MLSDQSSYDGAIESSGAYGNFAMQVTYLNHLQAWLLFVAGSLLACLLIWFAFRMITNKIQGLFI